MKCSLCLRRIIYLLQFAMEVKELYIRSNWVERVFTLGFPFRNEAGDIRSCILFLIHRKNAIRRHKRAKAFLERFAILG